MYRQTSNSSQSFSNSVR
ncbi:hypothetical protein CP8484711_1627A, partial [Chlamydia psittaci 84-8471/1]